MNLKSGLFGKLVTEKGCTSKGSYYNFIDFADLDFSQANWI